MSLWEDDRELDSVMGIFEALCLMQMWKLKSKDKEEDWRNQFELEEKKMESNRKIIRLNQQGIQEKPVQKTVRR